METDRVSASISLGFKTDPTDLCTTIDDSHNYAIEYDETSYRATYDKDNNATICHLSRKP